MMLLDDVLCTLTYVSVITFPLAYHLYGRLNWSVAKRRNISFLTIAAINMAWLSVTTIEAYHRKEPVPMASIDTKVIILGLAFIGFTLYNYVNDKWLSQLQGGLRLFMEFLTMGLILFMIIMTACWWEGVQLLDIYTISPQMKKGYLYQPGKLYKLTTQLIPYLTFIIFAAKNIGNYIQITSRSDKQQKQLSNAQLQKALAEAQWDALRAKVKPHFLYNALNSIAGLALQDGEKTRQMALALSRFFRYGCNRQQRNTALVEEEIEMIATYLEIEKIRFGDRLTYSFDIQQESKKIEIPYFLLQPIVENCIKHGTAENNINLEINLISRCINHHLVLYIRDNGIPFPENFIPGYGLNSIYERLDLVYPKHYEVEIHNRPYKEVMISIELPSNTFASLLKK